MNRSQRQKRIEETRNQIRRWEAERGDDPNACVRPHASSSRPSGGRATHARSHTSSEDAQALIERINHRLNKDLVNIRRFPTFVFAEPPQSDSLPLPPLVNPTAYALDPYSPENNPAFSLRHELDGYKRALHGLRHINDGVKRRLADTFALLNGAIAKFDKFKRLEWEKQRQMAIYPYATPDTTLRGLERFHAFSPLGLSYRLFMASLNIFGNQAHDKCNAAISSMNALLRLQGDGDCQLPTDIRTIVADLDLVPNFVDHVCCPSCFSLYDNDPTTCPARCTRMSLPLKPGEEARRCNRGLWRQTEDGGTGKIPVSRFLRRRIQDYIATLLIRPEIEDAIDSYMATAGERDMPDDVLHAPGIAQLRDKFGQPFCRRDAGSLRLVFRLSEDGVNPLGNKLAGKQASIGPLWLICLSLPRALRQRQENMCLIGVIPGREAPRLHAMNNIIEPIVDEAVELYEKGVYVTRTAHYPHGRLVMAAIWLQANDLPASRQLSGYAPHMSNLCCHICWATLQDLDDVDISRCRLRNWTHDKACSIAWKNAATIQEQELLFRENGIRWSEFHRLRYFDAILCSTLDVMHMFFERMLPHHLRSVWGMHADAEDGLGLATIQPEHDLSEEEIAHANGVLNWGDSAELHLLSTRALRMLCYHNNLQYGGRCGRKRMLHALEAYRGRNGLPAGNRPRRARIDKRSKDKDTNRTSKRQEPPPSRTPPRRQQKDKPRLTADDLLKQGLLTDVFKSRSKKFIETRLTDDAVVLVAQQHLAPMSEPYDRMMPARLRKIIHQSRIDANILDARTGKLINKATKTRRGPVRDDGAVLGRTRIEAIQHDLSSFRAPSSTQAPPKNVGEPSGGKLKASNYEVLGLVNIPTTLIRLWGGLAEDTREKRVLDNYMHLVKAVRLGIAPRTPPEAISRYADEICRYLTGLVELFPGTSITPYQHMAAHLPLFLRAHGPTHSWRCWIVERMNYVLQSLNTNNRFGELECTLFKQFCRRQSLRAIVQSHMAHFRPEFRKVVRAFYDTSRKDPKSIDIEAALRPEIMNYDYNFHIVEEEVTWDDGELQSLDPCTFKLLVDWIHGCHSSTAVPLGHIDNAVYLRKKVVRIGYTYSPPTRSSTRNSNVAVKVDEPHSSDTSTAHQAWRAAQITSLFSHTRRGGATERPLTQTFAVVKPYRELSDDDRLYDVYSQYGIAGGQLTYDDFDDPVLVSMSDVLGHASVNRIRVTGIATQTVICMPFTQVHETAFE